MAPPVVSSIEAKMEIIGIALIIVLWLLFWAVIAFYDLERTLKLIYDTSNDDDTRMQAQDALKKIGAIK
jgi:hypothetical protein